MTAAFLFTGTDHLLNAGRYRPMLPSYVPFPHYVVCVSGISEIAGAGGLMTQRWRCAAGSLLALYLVSETPANIKLAVDGVSAKRMPTSPWFYRGRLLLIPLAIWRAWDCSVRARAPARGRSGKERPPEYWCDHVLYGPSMSTEAADRRTMP